VDSYFEETKLQASENKMLRKLCDPKQDKLGLGCGWNWFTTVAGFVFLYQSYWKTLMGNLVKTDRPAHCGEKGKLFTVPTPSSCMWCVRACVCVHACCDNYVFYSENSYTLSEVQWISITFARMQIQSPSVEISRVFEDICISLLLLSYSPTYWKIKKKN
jgi:hypothetical protein